MILFLSGSVIFLIHKTRRQKEILLKQHAEALKKDIELKNKELVCNVSSIYTKNLVINNVARTLAKNMQNFSKANANLINDIINELRQNMNDCNWKEFETRFAKVHESFYESLDKKYPDLTITERKICAMLKLGLSSKEIAAITNTLPESIDTVRSRIRKKLELNKNENIIEFFQKFS
ncbi:MAG TPA: LuxR C-terminal-related transcriptional regulator [Bacteroidales bacterium]|nr:LuxR C-terminal-related transcriptional regulator [Bacteroidales bacterium]